MQNSHEGGEKIIRFIARGHAHIGWHTAAEWVMGDIQPPMFKVEPDCLHHGEAKRFLLFDGKRSVQRFYRMFGTLFILMCNRFWNEPFQEFFKLRKHAGYVSDAVSRIKLLNQRIIV